MLSYCLKCKTDTKCENPKVSKTNNGRIMLLSKCAVGNSKKSRFIKEQQASRLQCLWAIYKKKKRRKNANLIYLSKPERTRQCLFLT